MKGVRWHRVAHTGTHREVLEKDRPFALCAVSLGYILAIVVFIFTGVISLALTEGADGTILDVAVPDTAMCIRVDRKANYPAALLSMGSPPIQYKLMIRIDKLSSSEAAATIFSDKLVRSQTVECDARGVCRDLMLVQAEGPSSVFSPMMGRFKYASSNSGVSSYASAPLGLEGELLLTVGKSYWLTSTHLCWSDCNRAPGGMASAFYENTLQTTRENTSAVFPAGRVVSSTSSIPGCSNDSLVRLFPASASIESSWLLLTSNYLYEHDEGALESRRHIVESGASCIPDNDDETSRAKDLYTLACSLSASNCESVPSLPFRRVADRKIRIDVVSENDVSVSFENTNSLSKIDSLMSFSDSIVFSSVRLVILILTAAVVFVRSADKSNSPRYLLEHAIRVANESEHDIPLPYSNWVIGVQAAIGILAIVSRACVLFWYSWSTLLADRQARVCVSELTGIAASVLHFLMRNWWIKREKESPLTKLGGPMSAADSCMAVLVSFATPPLLAPHDGKFSTIGRMLMSILVSTVVIQRLYLSTASCALMASTVSSREHYASANRGYQTLLVISTLLWLLQTYSVSSALANLFIRPAAYSLSRASVYDAQSTVPFTLFLGIVAISIPSLNKNVAKILKEARETGFRKTKRSF